MKCSLDLIFLNRSLLLPILWFSSISWHCSFKKAFYLLAILWNSAFSWVYLSLSPLPFASLLCLAFVSPHQAANFVFLHFFSWGWFWSPPPAQCYRLSVILSAYYYLSVYRSVCHSIYQIWSLQSIYHLHCIVIRDLI